MRKIKRKFKNRIKNPEESISVLKNKLEDLLFQNVTVQIRSDLAFFSITGKLIKPRFSLIPYLHRVSNFGDKNKNEILPKDSNYGEVDFTLRLIKTINKDLIQLYSSNYIHKPIENIDEELKELVGKFVKVFINEKFYESLGLQSHVTLISAKLKFNKKEKIFHLQNFDLSLYVRFKSEAVVEILTIEEKYIWIEI